MLTAKQLFLVVFFVWIGIGVGRLLPKKFKLMKRVGMLNNADLIKLAKEGDPEAQRLRKESLIFIVIGLAVLVPLRLLSR